MVFLIGIRIISSLVLIGVLELFFWYRNNDICSALSSGDCGSSLCIGYLALNLVDSYLARLWRNGASDSDIYIIAYTDILFL